MTWSLAGSPRHAAVLRLYRDLIALRKRWPCLANCRKDLVRVDTDEQAQWLVLDRRDPGGSRALVLCNFGQTNRTLALDTGKSDWRMLLWTGATAYGGDPGAQSPPAELRKSAESIDITVAACSAVLYSQGREFSG